MLLFYKIKIGIVNQILIFFILVKPVFINPPKINGAIIFYFLIFLFQQKSSKTPRNETVLRKLK